MSLDAHVVIAGGGLAAQRCVETLRRSDHTGPITIVCAEPTAPYNRPPLSKDILAGTADTDSLTFRPLDWHTDNNVELLLGRTATALNTDDLELSLDDGTTLNYDKLLIATGATPRQLDLVAGAPNAHTLRTAEDATQLRAALTPGSNLAIIGGGFIGQEVAASARGLGVNVTLLEAMDAPLIGLLGQELGAWFADLHRSEGVDVRLGATAADAVRDDDGTISAIALADGTTIPCDTVLVAVGIVPADTWLSGSAFGDDGVTCDAEGRTTVPDVFAAGDVARVYDHLLGDHTRSEHWEAAGKQGAAAARAMLDVEPVAGGPASFWSDQYGHKIQYVGYAPQADDYDIHGDPDDNDFHVVWQRGGQPIAVLAVNRPRELGPMRQAIQQTIDLAAASR